VTRLADQVGYVSRGNELGRRGAVALELTVSGRDLAGRVAGWRELARASCQLPPAGRAQVTSGLHQLVMAVGEGYGTITRGLVPV
jgi:hypothetical protein